MAAFKNKFAKGESIKFSWTLLNWKKKWVKKHFFYFVGWISEHRLRHVSHSFFHYLIITLVLSNCVKILTNHFDLLSSQTSQILPTKMSYSANLKNVMSMENGQRSSGSQPLAEQELEASKPGPSPHDLAAQLKSSLLAEIGLTESDGPPLPSFR